MNQIEKFPLDSMNIKEEQISRLKQLFPEVFTEGNKIDWEKLRLTLGDSVDVGKERFGLNWAGKSECFKLIQQPSTGTLVPAREESINFETTENLFIEGDNLEVLKLLQKSYFGKVKMIYIDPPYNTGNDFVYTDDFKDNLKNYLELTGQVDSGGKKLSTNVESDGRFHSNWLNMMYPRLFLARNLLSNDGYIFISIDDKEQENLKKLCNEIFGEENFIANLIWDLGTGTAAGHFTRAHEYILVYAKSKESTTNFRYYGEEDIISERAIKKISKANPASLLSFPAGIDFESADRVFGNELGKSEIVRVVEGVMECKDGKLLRNISLEAGWAMKDQIISWLNGETTFDSKGQTVKRFYFDKNGILQYEKERGFLNPQTVLRRIASTRKGSIDLENLLGYKSFDFPKPVDLMKLLFSIVTKDNIIIDFFAGSCTTAHAVLELNKEDSGNRKFICVQIPEPTDEVSEAYKAGYKTIADIGKERIRRVIKKIEAEKEKQEPDMFEGEKKPQDLGFKVFKLKSSNFATWDANVEKNIDALTEQLFRHVDHISPAAEQEAILYELLLKAGFELTTEITKLTITGKTVYSVMDNALLICLERNLTHELLKAIAQLKPVRFICLDEGFRDNDQLKSNAVLLMKENGVQKFQTV